MNLPFIPEKKFPVEISSGIMMLGNYYFNLFLIKGSKKSILFEVGISGVIDTVIDQLQTIGIKPDYLIPSHPHADHITGLPGLSNQYPDAKILVGQGTKEFISHPKASGMIVQEDAFLSNGLEKLGLHPKRPPIKTAPDLSRADSIDDSLSLDLGNLSVELIPVEGHSPGNLIVKISGQKILFCSDCLGFHLPGRAFWPLFLTNYKSYLNVLKNIKQMKPEILCPAHQGHLEGTAATKAIEEAIDATLAISMKIKETSLSDPELVQEVFKEMYRDEFTLYSKSNIINCIKLLIKRVRETDASLVV